MIDFRYHLVSIIAIFMALAVGIVVGSGPLKGPIDTAVNTQVESLRKQTSKLNDQKSVLQAQIGYSDDVAARLGPSLLGTKLSGRRVVVVAFPGTDAALTDDLEATLKNAHAVVSGTVTLTDSWSDPAKAAELDDVVTNPSLLPPLPAGITFPDGATAPQRAAIALARSLVTRDPVRSGEPDQAAAAMLAGLSDLGVIKVQGTPSAAATLALVAAPPAPDQVSDATRMVTADRVFLAQALDDQDLGTVIAGTIASAADGGLVAAARADATASAKVSTVDSAELGFGRLAAALALGAETDGTSAAYGFADSADLVLPDNALPTP